MSINFKYSYFTKYQPFGIYDHFEVLESYNNTQSILKDSYSITAGSVLDPFDETQSVVSFDEYKRTNKPLIVFVEDLDFESVGAKSDMTTMHLHGRGKTWNFWSYFYIPSEFINKFQTFVHGNKIKENVDIFKNFMSTCMLNNFNDEEVKQLAKAYDIKYPELYADNDWRPKRPHWRYDMEVSMFHSVWKSGILYPICYNNPTTILDRGTHRSLIFGNTGNDVPIFFQYPVLDGSILDQPIKLKTTRVFADTIYEFRLYYKERYIEVCNIETNEIVYRYE